HRTLPSFPTRRSSDLLGSRDAAGARPTEDRHVASTRLIPVALRAAPGVTLALLVGWATLDVYAIGEPRWSAALFTVLSIGVVARSEEHTSELQSLAYL